MRLRCARSPRPGRPVEGCVSTSPAVSVAMSNAFVDTRSDCRGDARWQTDLFPPELASEFGMQIPLKQKPPGCNPRASAGGRRAPPSP
jgi:hypothetical protein